MCVVVVLLCVSLVALVSSSLCSSYLFTYTQCRLTLCQCVTGHDVDIFLRSYVRDCLFVCSLTSQQQASVSQGQVCIGSVSQRQVCIGCISGTGMYW